MNKPGTPRPQDQAVETAAPKQKSRLSRALPFFRTSPRSKKNNGGADEDVRPALARYAKSAATGKEGEDAAAHYVQTLGWTILDRNWRAGPLEMDLICRDGETIVFVEVKTRTSTGMATPAEAFTKAKRGHVIRAARAWLSAHHAWERACRFDLAAVTVDRGQYRTELIRHVIELGESEFGKGGRPVGRGYASWQPW